MTLAAVIKRMPGWGEFLFVGSYYWGWAAMHALFVTLHSHKLAAFDSGYLTSIMAVELPVLAISAAFLRLRGWTLASLDWHPCRQTTVLGALLALVGLLIHALTASAGLADASGHLHAASSTVAMALPVVLLAFIVNAVFEEIFLSGYLFKALAGHGPLFIIGVSTLLRVLAHIDAGPAESLEIAGIGLLYGAVYWRWRQLWPLLFAHTATALLIVAN